MYIVFIFLALAIGLLVGYIVANSKSIKLKERAILLESQLNESKKSSQSLLQQSESAHARILADRDAMHKEALARQEIHNREALEALQGRFDETVAKMKAELEVVTSEMLKQRQSEFEASSSSQVEKILEPLNDNIRRMRDAVNQNTIKHSEMGGQLSSNLQMVLEHSDAARQSADRLADALRGGGKIQGDWGETVLTELLESQGLSEGVHFETQAALRDAAGNAIISDKDKSLRPDVILHLDRDRDVVIDAKVSLSAYLDFMNAESEETRVVALKSHVASVEKHVKELADKDYSAYIKSGHTMMRYVIMFVPNTAALYAATQHKPDLWRKAMERGVYIADEQTLYAALKIIEMTWRQIAQADNHEKVYALANEMLDRVNMFMEKFAALGKRLDEAQKSYGEALGKIRESGKSIPNTCRKLVSLGATVKPRKGVSPDLIGLTPDTTPLEEQQLSKD